MIKDYYAELRLQRQATRDDIKKSYRQLALLYHPDKNKAPDAQEHFVRVTQAYYVLSDEGRRAAYDQYLAFESRDNGDGVAQLIQKAACMQWEQEGQARARQYSSYSFAEFSGDIIIHVLGEGLIELVIEGVGAVVKGTGEALGEVLSNIDL